MIVMVVTEDLGQALYWALYFSPLQWLKDADDKLLAAYAAAANIYGSDRVKGRIFLELQNFPPVLRDLPGVAA